MNDPGKTREPASPVAQKSRRHFFRRIAVGTIIAGAATGIGLKTFAQGGGYAGWHRGGFMHGPLDPAAMDEHLDRLLKHLYVEIDATDAQQRELAPIVKGAARDLAPLRAKMHEGRRQAIELLSRERVDRAELDRLRADQLGLADEASKRFTQALADVADVLTLEQRKQLAERVRAWRGHRG
jgi:periplasmic protein CpxP/Spy